VVVYTNDFGCRWFCMPINALNSGDLGDFCLSALFDELTSYVKEKKGVLK